MSEEVMQDMQHSTNGANATNNANARMVNASILLWHKIV